jgi:hypothetical protein
MRRWKLDGFRRDYQEYIGNSISSEGNNKHKCLEVGWCLICYLYINIVINSIRKPMSPLSYKN